MMEIDHKNIPKHIAVIMDGNGRWARKKVKTDYLVTKTE
jgi:undecaprenyl diphosphate synthase